jgi:hypothetical protein
MRVEPSLLFLLLDVGFRVNGLEKGIDSSVCSGFAD